MINVTIIEPNISDEENEENLKRIIEIIENIAREINQAE